MDATTEKVEQKIREAFPPKRSVAFSPLVNSVEGTEPSRVEALLKPETDWTLLDPEWLDAIPGGLAFLSDEALCFYIPSFLIADLNGRLGIVDPAYTLSRGFDSWSLGQRIGASDSSEQTWTEHAEQRWAGLTREQVCAVVSYIEWRVAKAPIHFEQRLSEALESYWYKRVVG